MGKPSSTQLSRKSSSQSLNTSMGKNRMNKSTVTMKHRLSRKRLRDKTQNNINKLFNRLRNTSSTNTSLADMDMSQSTSQIDSVIVLDDTQDTVIHVNNKSKRTSNVGQENLIIIPDDDMQKCSTPIKKSLIHHSTPKSKTSLDDLILAQSNNNTYLQNFNDGVNLTRTINRDSYLTIDLTTDSGLNRTIPTVIDLENTTDHEVTVVSAGNASHASSMSGDSEVTILQQPISRKLKKFTNGIASLNAAEKGKLLELITQTIFNGCNIPAGMQNSLTNVQNSLPRAPETAVDTYIKEVILGRKVSQNSIGSNVYHPDRPRARTGPRMVVIDGSNVAMEHGRGQRFSVRGLQICIDYFLRRGHVVKAFVPRFRCKQGMSTDGRLLSYLERMGLVIFTPSREVKGRLITPYDDRYILQCAAEFDGVVVTGDNYRDLINENNKWRFVIENRLLPFTWVDDMIMFPKDPLGRSGPTLEQFLKHPEPNQQCNLNPINFSD